MSDLVLGEELRNIMWDKECGFAIMSYCDTGFLSGNECALLKVIIDEANRDPESCCRLKKEALAYLSMQSERTMFNNLNSLKELGLIVSDKIHDGALKYINRTAWVRLKDIYKHEVDGQRHKNIFIPRVLRDEMKARGIASIMDLTEDVLDDVYEKAEIKRKEFLEARHNTNLDEKNNHRRELDSAKFTTNQDENGTRKSLDSAKSTTNQGSWIVQNLPPTRVIEYYNNKNTNKNSKNSIKRERMQSLFQQSQDDNTKEQQKYLRKRKQIKRKR